MAGASRTTHFAGRPRRATMPRRPSARHWTGFSQAWEISAAMATGNMHRSGRFGQRWHTGRVNDHPALRTRAKAFAAYVVLVSQRNVNDAALAAVHRVEAEWRSGPLDLISRREGAHPQFLDAQSRFSRSSCTAAQGSSLIVRRLGDSPRGERPSTPLEGNWSKCRPVTQLTTGPIGFGSFMNRLCYS